MIANWFISLIALALVVVALWAIIHYGTDILRIVKPWFKRDTNPEYLEITVKCPHCFGRGRVPKEGYGFAEGTDPYEVVYKEEQALAEAEEIIGKADNVGG